jgi:hypothetical protein
MVMASRNLSDRNIEMRLHDWRQVVRVQAATVDKRRTPPTQEGEAERRS